MSCHGGALKKSSLNAGKLGWPTFVRAAHFTLDSFVEIYRRL